jgi:hypothetical protein
MYESHLCLLFHAEKYLVSITPLKLLTAFCNVDLLAVVSSEQDGTMNMFTDDINAYSFLYPSKLSDTDVSFQWYF